MCVCVCVYMCVCVRVCVCMHAGMFTAISNSQFDSVTSNHLVEMERLQNEVSGTTYTAGEHTRHPVAH